MSDNWDDWEDDFGSANNQPTPTATTSNDDYAWVDDSSQDNSSLNGGVSQASNWQEDFPDDSSNQGYTRGNEINGSDSTDFNDFSNNEIENNVTNRRFNLNMKQAGIVIAGGFVVLALLLYILNNINFSKKPVPQQAYNNEATQQQSSNTAPQEQPAQQAQVQTQPTVKSDVSLITVPKDTTIDYSGKIYEATGMVTDKQKYLCDNQVVYLIKVDIQMGTNSMSANYFCGYNVFNSVSVGDVVTVNYQQVSDTCFSVNTLVK